LVLRTEDLDRTLAGALQDFLDLHKAPRVVHANQRARTDQADTYRSVLARFRLPRDAVDAVYARRLARHFYSESMLEGFRRRWAEA
jgi:hypothetical protein